jgi:hypothetical protein
MADINQFLRSKERLAEILHELTRKAVTDTHTKEYIKVLENAIRILDEKIDACLAGLNCNPAGLRLSQSSTQAIAPFVKSN